MAEFNKQAFAYLLQRAKGERSINRFGYDANVDPGYISRLLRCLVEQPPSAMVLAKIAGSASGDITVEQFLRAAGYLDSDSHNAMGDVDVHDDGAHPDLANPLEGAAEDDPMVEEFLSFCKEMIDRPVLLDVFKQVRGLSDEKLRRALKMIKMIEEMGD